MFKMITTTFFTIFGVIVVHTCVILCPISCKFAVLLKISAPLHSPTKRSQSNREKLVVVQYALYDQLKSQELRHLGILLPEYKSAHPANTLSFSGVWTSSIKDFNHSSICSCLY